MRMTFALLFDLSLDGLMPGLFDNIAEFDWAKRIDRGAARVRVEFARIEVENAEDETSCRRLAERASRDLGEIAAIRLFASLPHDWKTLGRVEVVRVENAPNVDPGHNLGGANPAVLCPECQQPMVVRRGRSGKPFHGCRDYPRCHGTRPISD